MKVKNSVRFFPFLLFIACPLWPQDSGVEPHSFVGMSLAELFGRFGPPRAVYAARGEERWQDDVVFEYAQGDFYIYKDRVWQVGLASAYGVALGDPKPAALLVIGDKAEDRGNYMLAPLSGAPWPLMLRINFTGSGLTSAIFVYRPDF
jgi:hypothetical protein